MISTNIKILLISCSFYNVRDKMQLVLLETQILMGLPSTWPTKERTLTRRYLAGSFPYFSRLSLCFTARFNCMKWLCLRTGIWLSSWLWLALSSWLKRSVLEIKFTPTFQWLYKWAWKKTSWRINFGKKFRICLSLQFSNMTNKGIHTTFQKVTSIKK